MDVREFRVGNIVYDTKDHCKVTVSELDFIAQIYKYYEPIPLTEEWLIKFGFESRNEGADNTIVIGNGNGSELNIEKDLVSDVYNVLFTRGNTRNKVPGIDYDYVYAGEIKFVHQLQNLVHALTGEELTIKD